MTVPHPRSENRIDRSGVAMSPRTVCNATSAAWRSGCSGMVRPPVLPLLARLGTCSTSATCHCASVTMAQVSEAISLARRPAFIENSNITWSRAGERVVTREPKIARSWIGLTIFAYLPCIMHHNGCSRPTHIRRPRKRKNAMSQRSCQGKSPLNPASRLHCATKANRSIYRAL